MTRLGRDGVGISPLGFGAAAIGNLYREVGEEQAHHHVWDLAVRDQDWITGRQLRPLRGDFTITDLAPRARAAGVDRTVLVQTVTVPEETPEFLALAEEHELIAGVVGWVDLTRPDIADEPARLRDLPGGRHLKGIRHQVQAEPDPQRLLRADVRRGPAAVAAAGLVYDLVVVDHQLPASPGPRPPIPGSPSSSTTWASPRSPRASWSPGRRPSARRPPCPRPSASSPAWSPRPTSRRGHPATCGPS